MTALKATQAEFEAYVIETATTWTAFVRRGPFDKFREEAGSREAIVPMAKALAATHGRAALIYAVNGEGRSVMAGYYSPKGDFTSAIAAK
jgi:hypothetical protein